MDSFPSARELGCSFIKVVLMLTLFGRDAHSAGGRFTSECAALKSGYERNLLIYHTPKTESSSHPRTHTSSSSGEKTHHFVSWCQGERIGGRSLLSETQSLHEAFIVMILNDQPKLTGQLSQGLGVAGSVTHPSQPVGTHCSQQHLCSPSKSPGQACPVPSTLFHF